MPNVSTKEFPRGTKIPDHVALILDGNRRWARSHGLKPWEGHKAGYEAVKKLARAARKFGVHTFTIWSFSTDNWERPKREIDEIMKILKIGLREFEKEAHKDKVRLIHLGRKDRFPKEVVKIIEEVESSTKKYHKNILNLALDYGGRDEIVRAVRKIVDDNVPSGKIDEKLFESYLDTSDQPYPYPDLFIRTSGEQRTSGLFPWQMAYAEYYWEEGHLPDFTARKLKEAILDFSRRRRRFGGSDAMEHFSFDPEMVAKLELSWWRLARIPKNTGFIDYALKHLKEQYGLSKDLGKKAAKYMVKAFIFGSEKDWKKALINSKKFYKLVKSEIKLAFEPSLVAFLEVRLRKQTAGKEDMEKTAKAEITARKLYAEVYRISIFQAAKLAHLRVMADVERNLAEKGMGEEHWEKAENYLSKFYRALKERIA